MNGRSHFLPMVGVTVLCFIVVFACSLDTDTYTDTDTATAPTTDEIEEAVAYAEEMTSEATDLMIDARTTGDTASLDAFAEDLDVVDIIASEPEPTEQRVGTLTAPTDGPSARDWVIANATHGDILLFKGDGTAWTTELMQLLLVGDYFHAGVYVIDPETGTPYIVSASVRISGAGIESGILVQTIEEVTEGSIRVAIIKTGLGLGENEDLDEVLQELATLPPEATLYSFLYPNLDPVPRFNDFFWYCSKVAWRAYAAVGVNTEYTASAGSWVSSMDFYLIDDRWVEFKDTLVFELYHEFLSRLLPRWPALVDRLTVAKLKKVLTELITPDEIYEWGNNSDYEVLKWGDTTSNWN